jgi:hypothetical protein
MKKIILSIVVAMVAVASFAQGGGGRQGGMWGGMQNNPLMLLTREDVQEDLGLNSDQKLKVAEYFAPDALRERMMSVFQNSGMSFEDMRSEDGRKKMQDVMTKQMDSMRRKSKAGSLLTKSSELDRFQFKSTVTDQSSVRTSLRRSS